MEENQGRPPGLRISGKRAHWRATKAAVAAGYPVKSVNLTRYRDEPAMLRSQCERLQAEMLSWDRTKSAIGLTFTGTFNSLFDLYENDPESSYQKLKRSSRHPYSVYMRMMRVRIGNRHINDCDGRDLNRWFLRSGRQKTAASRASPRPGWQLQCCAPQRPSVSRAGNPAVSSSAR